MFIAEVQTVVDDHSYILGRYPLTFLPPEGTLLSLTLQRTVTEFEIGMTVTGIVTEGTHVRVGDPIAQVTLFVEDIAAAGFALPPVA